MDAVYGDHIHQNDGTHLSGGIDATIDRVWQQRWRSLTGQRQQLYTVPNGAEGKNFVRTLRNELAGVCSQKWNSERPLVFIMTMLVQIEGVTTFQDVRRRLQKKDAGLAAQRICGAHPGHTTPVHPSRPRTDTTSANQSRRVPSI